MMTRETVPCREGDSGKFEVISRDGWARIGRFHTSTHVMNTPALLPVINPNIRTIEPREMWEKYGFEAIITNSYVIWKHDKLKTKALSDGVHSLLDYPGVIMTDSGTFQNYVYGDVEVGVEEIVNFQREIGVDIATMLDVFGTPEMTREEIENAVIETASRGAVSIEAAGDVLLNGPIQGGLHTDLRRQSAEAMASQDFSIHPIGGIVPLMERQRYREFVEILLACREHIPWERPVHMFGCGHPHLFPICVALGADLFDSAAYALFARDDRLLMPWGTAKLDDLTEFPISTEALAGQTPDSVRSLGDEARCELLARHNLEVTSSEISRCRQAVRDGTIWRLVEERSHTNPSLREATEYLYENIPEGLINTTNPLRSGGVWMSQDAISQPPSVASLGRLLTNLHTQTDGAIVFGGSPGPWRERIGGIVQTIHQRWPKASILIETPLGLIPYSMEDVSPWAHIAGPKSMWSGMDEDAFHFDMEALVGPQKRIARINIGDEKKSQIKQIEDIFGEGIKVELEGNRSSIDRKIAIDKMAYFLDVNRDLSKQLLADCTFVYSKTNRVKNIITKEGIHILSPRLTDGGLSLTLEGARKLHGSDIPTVIVNDDSIPFTRKGRNVMHGFILDVRGQLTPGLPCIIEDSSGIFIGHGVALCTAEEAKRFRKGVAIKVRDGAGE